MYRKSQTTGFPSLITIFSAPNYLDVYNNKGITSLGLHRISASASANSKFGHFSQIRLRPNFWPNLADANATALRSVSYLITDKKLTKLTFQVMYSQFSLFLHVNYIGILLILSITGKQ